MTKREEKKKKKRHKDGKKLDEKGTEFPMDFIVLTRLVNWCVCGWNNVLL